jgi:3-oxoacyl-[acyl-carrier protein] reductase
MELKGATAIVTGSATGTGAAVARMLAARGSHLIINYTKSLSEAEETAAACRQYGVEALLCRADVSQDAECRRMVEEAVTRFGRLDVLVNNAGTTKFVPHAELDGLDAADFQRIYGVNVIGAYQMVRAAAPHLKASGHGAVVNLSSIAGITGLGSSIAYAASKGALNTLTKSLARVLGPEIRVNAVCPGPISSRWLRDLMGEERYQQLVARTEAATPLHKVSTPEDVAEVVLWLIQGSALVTGETVIIDAGFHLGPGL